jgi:hypothetical protein
VIDNLAIDVQGVHWIDNVQEESSNVIEAWALHQIVLLRLLNLFI